jgi:hypothetical protein
VLRWVFIAYRDKKLVSLCVFVRRFTVAEFGHKHNTALGKEPFALRAILATQRCWSKCGPLSLGVQVQPS